MEEEKNVNTPIEETEEVQTVLDIDDEFLKASLEDENVEVNLDVESDVEGIGAIEDEGIGSVYAPRLTAPSTTDKNWLHYTKGGYNYCILISGSSCLPNCVGYAWGRWREILGTYHKLSRANAENWWGNTGDGYQRGQTPKVGAVICWRKGQAGNAADGAGHVAIVEKVNSDGSITTSNSGYGGSRFWTATYKYPYNVGNNYYFQGFIYNPAVKDETPIITETNSNNYSGKFKVGDKAKFTGRLYRDSNGNGAGASRSNLTATISIVKAGAKCPYNINNGLGWVKEENLTSISSSNYSKGNYKALGNMNVRTGAGTNYSIKKVSQLTADGRKNATSTNSNANAVYKAGTVFTALEIINNSYGTWAKTPSGYVCIKGASGTVYCSKV